MIKVTMHVPRETMPKVWEHLFPRSPCPVEICDPPPPDFDIDVINNIIFTRPPRPGPDPPPPDFDTAVWLKKTRGNAWRAFSEDGGEPIDIGDGTREPTITELTEGIMRTGVQSDSATNIAQILDLQNSIEPLYVRLQKYVK